jgi:hypothetical protein
MLEHLGEWWHVPMVGTDQDRETLAGFAGESGGEFVDILG